MLVAQAPGAILSVVAAIFVLLFTLVTLVVFLKYGRVWVLTKINGIPLSILDLIGMTFRKIDMKSVVRALIAARQAGVEVSINDMEHAYLQGADLDRVTRALIQARRDDPDLTFRDLVETDLEERAPGESWK